MLSLNANTAVGHPRLVALTKIIYITWFLFFIRLIFRLASAGQGQEHTEIDLTSRPVGVRVNSRIPFCNLRVPSHAVRHRAVGRTAPQWFPFP